MTQTHPNFPQMGQTPPPMPPMRPKKKKLIWPWIVLAIFVIGIIAAFLDDDKASEYKSDSATQTELTNAIKTKIEQAQATTSVVDIR